jgi:hypothetical protein
LSELEATDVLLGRPLDEALRLLDARGVTNVSVEWTQAFAGQFLPARSRDTRARTDERVVRVRERGRLLTAARFLREPDFNADFQSDAPERTLNVQISNEHISNI